MKTVATFSQAEEAHLLRAFLAGSGIEATIRDDVTATVDIGLSNSLRGVKVDVSDEDFPKASELIASAKAGEPEVG